jgi:hypothetical protein
VDLCGRARGTYALSHVGAMVTVQMSMISNSPLCAVPTFPVYLAYALPIVTRMSACTSIGSNTSERRIEIVRVDL